MTLELEGSVAPAERAKEIACNVLGGGYDIVLACSDLASLRSHLPSVADVTMNTFVGVSLRQSGVEVGTVRHVPEEERLHLVIELIGTEALKTSEIEGVMLDRDSVQSSLRRQFGLHGEIGRSAPAEQGIAEMLTDLYRSWADPLDDATLFRWHRCFDAGTRRIARRRRLSETPGSNAGGFGTDRCTQDLLRSAAFRISRGGDDAVLSLVQCHKCQGRNSAAGAEKALVQGAEQPSLTALALLIHRHRND